MADDKVDVLLCVCVDIFVFGTVYKSPVLLGADFCFLILQQGFHPLEVDKWVVSFIRWLLLLVTQ